MPAGGLQVAKRELVKVLVTVALFYSVRLSVNRDSADEEVLKAFRPVSLKVKLKVKRERWTAGRKKGYVRSMVNWHRQS